MGRRSGEPSYRVIVGKSVADPNQTHPQAVSQLGYQTRRPSIRPIDRGAGPTFVGKVRDVMADISGELPGAAIHGGFLHCLELRIDRVFAWESHQLLHARTGIRRFESS